MSIKASTQPRLPVDTIGEILTHLEGNTRALLACCLVSREWREMSQKLVHPTVRVRFARKRLGPQEVYEHLLRHPHLATHVKALQLVAGVPYEEHWDAVSDIYQETAIPKILELLPPLATLTLTSMEMGLYSRTQGCGWLDLPKETLDALMNPVQFSSITKLELISMWDASFDFVNSFVHLKVLKLCSVEFQPEEGKISLSEPTISSKTDLLRLELSLSRSQIERVGEFFKHPSCRIRLDRLHTLALQSEGHLPVHQLVTHLFDDGRYSRLKELVIEHLYLRETPPAFPLYVFPDLQKLVWTIPYRHGRFYAMEGLIQTLKTYPASSLKTLTLKVECRSWSTSFSWEEEEDGLWKELDSLVSARTSRFFIDIHPSGLQGDPSKYPDFDKKLPTMAEQGMVRHVEDSFLSFIED